jgi:hypothetical protein
MQKFKIFDFCGKWKMKILDGFLKKPLGFEMFAMWHI